MIYFLLIPNFESHVTLQLTELKIPDLHHFHGSDKCCVVEHVRSKSSVSGHIQCQNFITSTGQVEAWDNPITFNDL